MRFRALPTLFCPAIVLVLSMAALPALGTDPTRTGLAAPRSYPGPGLHGELELALADAIAMGLENNLNVEIQRHAPLIAHEDARMAMGIYDPEWFSEMGWQHVKNPNAFTLNLTLLNEEKTLDGIGGFRGLVPWLGATYSATLESGQVETNSTLQSRSPEYRSAVVFSGSIPLMKGLIWSEPWTLVKTTQVLYQGSTEEFRRNVMDIVQQIEDAYWALIANDELVRVAEKSVETAQALLDQVQIQYEVGVVSKVEIAQAEAGLAAREFDLIVAQNRYQTTMDVLIDLVLGSNLTADSRIQIVPTDRPDALVSYDVDVEEAARIAFQRRPELALAQKDIERLEINVKFAKNQRLPQFDIQSFYRMEGLGGSQNPNLIDFTQDPPGPAAPGTVPERSWGSTFDNFFTSKAADSYGIRGFLSIPRAAARARGEATGRADHHPRDPQGGAGPGLRPRGHRSLRAPGGGRGGAAAGRAHPAGVRRVDALRCAAQGAGAGQRPAGKDRRLPGLSQLRDRPGPLPGHDPAQPERLDRSDRPPAVSCRLRDGPRGRAFA